MSKLQQAILTLQNMQAGSQAEPVSSNPVSGLLVTVAYLCVMLSVPVDSLGMLLWFAVYPIIAAPMFGIVYSSVFTRSLYVLPLLLFIGVFNPFFDRLPVFSVCGVIVSRGWLTFLSVVVRGLLSVQAIVMLVNATGFIGLCRALRRVGLPSFLVTQLLMVYRYMTVLLVECLAMNRARMARSYGRERLPLKMWGQMTGQLFLRTVARSERINRAMLARGFSGTMPEYRHEPSKLSAGAIVFVVSWIAVFAVLRFVNISSLLCLDRLIN